MKHERLIHTLRVLSRLVAVIGFIAAFYTLWKSIQSIAAWNAITQSSSAFSKDLTHMLGGPSPAMAGIIVLFEAFAIGVFSCFLASIGYAFAALIENTDPPISQAVGNNVKSNVPVTTELAIEIVDGKRIQKKKCPVCSQIIDIETIKCRFCGNEFNPEETDKQIEQFNKQQQDLVYQKENRICPYCKEMGVVSDVILQDGSTGFYCPHCEKYFDYDRSNQRKNNS